MKTKDKKLSWDMSSSELNKKIRDIEDALAELNVSRYTKQSKNIREAKNLRQRLAVMKSIKRIKELSV